MRAVVSYLSGIFYLHMGGAKEIISHEHCTSRDALTEYVENISEDFILNLPVMPEAFEKPMLNAPVAIAREVKIEVPVVKPPILYQTLAFLNAQKAQANPKEVIEKLCPWCGKIFSSKNDHCSTSCSAQTSAAVRSEKAKKTKKDFTKEYTCLQCESKYYRYYAPSELGTLKVFCCTKKCLYNYWSANGGSKKAQLAATEKESS